MADFLQTLVTAVAVGSVYALIALGYTMVYGILKFINFAHSDVVVLGAWLSFTVATYLMGTLSIPADAAPLWLGAVVLLSVMLLCGGIGFTIERLAYKPLRKAPRLNVLITAIGVSLLLQNTGQLRSQPIGQHLNLPFGPSPKRMPTLIEDRALVTLEFAGPTADAPPVPVRINVIDVAIVIAAIVLMFGLELLVYRTKIGMAMRAVSFSVDNAALMGVPVDRIISFTFVLGSMLAAAAGFLWALKYPGLNQPAHEMWVLLGLKAFVAAVVGGIGNIRGAVLGGFLIAGIEYFGMLLFSKQIDPLLGTNLGSNLREVYVFTVLIVVLLVRPSGLLGTPAREKV